MICVYYMTGAPEGSIEKKLFVVFPWVVTCTGPGFMVCVCIL